MDATINIATVLRCFPQGPRKRRADISTSNTGVRGHSLFMFQAGAALAVLTWIPFTVAFNHAFAWLKHLWTTGLVGIISWRTWYNLVWSKPWATYHKAGMPQHQLIQPAHLLPLHQITCWGRHGYSSSVSFQTWNFARKLNVWRALSGYRNQWQANWPLVMWEA